MKRTEKWMGMLLAVVLLTAMGRADEETAVSLKFGDAMPVVSGIDWLLGADPAAGQEGRPEYIVYDCWASWCGPCIQSIPHLNDLAAKYSNRVAIAGVAVWDELDNVKKTLEKKGAGIHYAIGFDTAGEAAEKWMKGAGQDGIPCAFIVNSTSNILLWYGHPMTMDAVLQQIMDGGYDPETSQRSIEAEAEIQQLMANGSWDEAQQKVDEWRAAQPDKAAVFSVWIQVQKKDADGTQRALNELLSREMSQDEALNVMGLMVLALDRFPDSTGLQETALNGAGRIARLSPDDVMLQGMYWYTLNAAKRYDEAGAVADQMLKLSWDNAEKLAELVEGMLMDEVGSHYYAQAERAIARVRELSDDASSIYLAELKLAAVRGEDDQVEKTVALLLQLETPDAEMINTAAWELLSNKQIEKNYTAEALTLAEKAEVLTMGENPAILDTLALAEFRSGHVERAIEIEKNAIQLAPQYDFLQMQLAMFEDALKTNQPAAAAETTLEVTNGLLPETNAADTTAITDEEQPVIQNEAEEDTGSEQ